MKLFRNTFFLWLLAYTPCAQAEKRIVWQTIHDYNTIVEPENGERQKRHEVNPFLSYTSIGTDFGFVGPAESSIGWRKGQIGVTLGNGSDEWAGMWHSLSRLARMKDFTLDFTAPYPSEILAEHQPRITGLQLVVRGKGKIKIDLADRDNKILWSSVRNISKDEFSEELYDLPTDSLRAVKTMTWIAEPGSDLDIDRIEFRMETPDMPMEKWWFLASYVKALTCYSSSTGLVRDRAHIDDASFDSMASTGMFCLATAAASGEGIVSKDFASRVLHRAHQASKELRGPYGLLPHFVGSDESGKLVRHKGTEYSTVDTTLFDLSLLISAKILDEDALLQELLAQAKQLKLKELINDKGRLSHGVEADGKTIIPYDWYDWGGESALVLVMLRLSDGQASAVMSKSHWPHQGTGFISEIQSLLLPQFDSETSDALSGANWREVRKRVLRDQKNYVSSKLAGRDVSYSWLYGYSAGEQKRGLGYAVGGVDLEDQMLIHPHYILMAAAVDDEPNEVKKTMELLEQKRIFTPLGMVENVSLRTGEKLPMIGSLNASFEVLGAYHFLKKISNEQNRIYEAATTIPELNNAVKIFYP